MELSILAIHSNVLIALFQFGGDIIYRSLLVGRFCRAPVVECGIPKQSRSHWDEPGTLRIWRDDYYGLWLSLLKGAPN